MLARSIISALYFNIYIFVSMNHLYFTKMCVILSVSMYVRVSVCEFVCAHNCVSTCACAHVNLIFIANRASKPYIARKKLTPAGRVTCQHVARTSCPRA